MIFSALLCLVVIISVGSFQLQGESCRFASRRILLTDSKHCMKPMKDLDTNDADNVGFPFLAEFWKSAVATLDDTIEDFFYKRMGNGEIFYGKRKVNPSGRVDGGYNGFGLSDKQRIEDFSVVKMERLERKRLREEQTKKVK